MLPQCHPRSNLSRRCRPAELMYLSQQCTAYQRINLCSLDMQYNRSDQYGETLASYLAFFSLFPRSNICSHTNVHPASKTLLDQLCKAFPQESQQMTLMLTSILAIAISVPSIGLRWLARVKTSKLGWDDYMALVAATLLLLLASLQLESKHSFLSYECLFHSSNLFLLTLAIGTSLGFGRHVWNVNPANAIPLLKIYWISQVFYALVQLVSMVSILALYSRVFPARWFRLAVRIGIIFLGAHNVIYTGMVTFRCIPMDAIWDVRVSGRCLDLNLIGFTGAVMHITEHFTVLLLPLWELWKLKLSRRKKIQLVLLFTLGSL